MKKMDTSAAAFHSNCLVTWQTNNCPACYYIKNPDLMKNSACMKCNRTESKWYCLMCGHVGCGQGVQAHALQHYKETTHKYAIDLNSFRVWDYKLKMDLHNIPKQQLATLRGCSQETKPKCCRCPVCLHLSTPKLFKQSVCMGCGIAGISKLWICLSCSYIGCSRQLNRHAFEHNAKTKHPYTMQLESFSVWDYKERKFLHRQLNEAMMVKNEIVQHDGEHLKEYFDRRMNRLEHEWMEYCGLTEANKKMVKIVERLLILAEDKKELEEKLCEHDSKLKELLKQFVNNRFGENSATRYSPAHSCHMQMIQNEQIEEINKTENQQDIGEHIELKNNFCTNKILPNPAKVRREFQTSKFISLIILGLLIYHSFVLIMQKLGQTIFNFL